MANSRFLTDGKFEKVILKWMQTASKEDLERLYWEFSVELRERDEIEKYLEANSPNSDIDRDML